MVAQETPGTAIWRLKQRERQAQDRDAWRALVGGLYSVGAKGNDDNNEEEVICETSKLSQIFVRHFIEIVTRQFLSESSSFLPTSIG